MKKGIVVAVFVAAVVSSAAVAAPPQSPMKKPTEKEFYVYKDGGARENHWIPSGWMGDFGDGKLSQSYSTNTVSGKSCMKLTYSAERKQGAGWFGIFWQYPVNNWGDKRSSGYDLSDYKKITFYVRGEKGGEIVDKFQVGGITGQTEEGDSDEISGDQVELTREWRKYEIDLRKRDLSHIIGGFCVVMNGESNPNGLTMYIDEVKYEK